MGCVELQKRRLRSIVRSRRPSSIVIPEPITPSFGTRESDAPKVWQCDLREYLPCEKRKSTIEGTAVKLTVTNVQGDSVHEEEMTHLVQLQSPANQCGRK